MPWLDRPQGLSGKVMYVDDPDAKTYLDQLEKSEMITKGGNKKIEIEEEGKKFLIVLNKPYQAKDGKTKQVLLRYERR